MAPLLLFVQGDVTLLSQPQLAIVGSRNPSASGLEFAKQFAKDMIRADLVVTSGMALGIDGAAHRGALAANGKTIAVLGTGPDTIYPKHHQQLAEEIVANGATVTEFPTGVKALPAHFPRRNRIVSGLSLGVLVIEASLRSGSLITARLAAEQGREVFALPGSIKNSLARGCHYLIRQGAKLVESADDIFAELGPLISAQHTQSIENNGKITPPGLDINTVKVLKALDYAPTSIDTLVARTGLTVCEIASMLLILELKGCISQSSSGYLRE